MFKSRAACTGASGSRCRGGCGQPGPEAGGSRCRPGLPTRRLVLSSGGSGWGAGWGVADAPGGGASFIGAVTGTQEEPPAVWVVTLPGPSPLSRQVSLRPRPTGEAGGPAGEASVLSPQRTCSSPTRTPRPSSCPARASRWTWRRTARTTASTSTCSTCATSCGACGASPAPAGGRPRPPRYRRPVAGLGPRLRGASGRESRAPGLPSRTGARCLSCLSPPGPAPPLPRGAPRGPELPRGCQGPWPGGP